MSVTFPFRISLFNADREPQDAISAPLELHATVRSEGASVASFMLDNDDENVAVLSTPGFRCALDYFHDPADPLAPMRLMSGMVGPQEGTSSAAGTRTFEIFDDYAYILGLLGVPNPDGDITEQGDENAYYTVTGPAETVAKTHIAAAAAWHGVPVVIAPDLGRGNTITVSVRMHKLADRLFPAVTQAGVIVTVQQVGADLVVDCREPETVGPLTEASGVVVSGKFTATPPTVTRVIVGGGGEGTARLYHGPVVNAAVESAFGVRIPVFRDARDTTDPDVMTARAWEVLNEGAPKAGVSAELSETDDFRFGVTLNVGDLAEVHLTGAPPVEDSVTEVAFDYTARDGLVVTPHVGDVATTFNDLTAAAIEYLAARTRDQDARS